MWVGKCIHSLVGGELSFPKLGSLLVGLSVKVCQIFFIAITSKITVFEVRCVFWPVDWNWSGPRTNPYTNFLLDLCVCWWCCQTGGGALERLQIFILAEGIKIIVLALSGRESSLVQTFCESCVYLDITLPSILMTQRFVIEGCLTLKLNNRFD